MLAFGGPLVPMELIAINTSIISSNYTPQTACRQQFIVHCAVAPPPRHLCAGHYSAFACNLTCRPLLRKRHLRVEPTTRNKKNTQTTNEENCWIWELCWKCVLCCRLVPFLPAAFEWLLVRKRRWLDWGGLTTTSPSLHGDLPLRSLSLCGSSQESHLTAFLAQKRVHQKNLLRFCVDSPLLDAYIYPYFS